MGGWAYARALVPEPLRPGASADAYELVLELSHPEAPEASLAMFVARATEDGGFGPVPELVAECAAFGAGGGPFGDARCVATGVARADFSAGTRDALRVFGASPASAARASRRHELPTALDVRYDYARVVIPPEELRPEGRFGGTQNASNPEPVDAYVVAVWNPPGASADDARDVRLRAAFFPVRDERLDAPRCAFACSGVGECVESGGDFADASGADAGRARTWTCACPANKTGAYCQNALTPLPVDGAPMERSGLASGGWDVYAMYFSSAAADASFRSASGPEKENGVLVELRRSRRSPDAFPMVFVKRGAPPAAFEAVFAPEMKGASIVLDPDTNGRSVGALGQPNNSAIEVALPPARAWWAFGTTSRSWRGLPASPRRRVSPSPPDAPGTSRRRVCPTRAPPGGSGSSATRTPTTTRTRPRWPSTSLTTRLIVMTTRAPTPRVPSRALLPWSCSRGTTTPSSATAAARAPRRAAGHEPGDDVGREWEGELEILYHERVGTGFDYRDATSAFCDGVDCAVEDDHEVFFPLFANANETTYVGVYNSRAAAQPGWVDGTLSRHESARFSEPMAYSIRAAVSSAESPACLRDCAEGGGTRGACLPDRAPACDGFAGVFGAGGGVDPEPLPLGAVSGSAEEGTSRTTALTFRRARGP